MSGFILHLQSAARYECIEDVASFVGKDASGGFGILPGRARFITVLEYGLARFRTTQGVWQYVASPGAVLNFTDNELFFSTRSYLRDDDYGRVSALLAGRLAKEESELKAVKDNLQSLEQALFRHLCKLDRWEG